MPQSNHDRVAELHNIPEHTADIASARKTKEPKLSAHEETLQAEDHADNSSHTSALHHGKAAALDAAKAKPQNKAQKKTAK